LANLNILVLLQARMSSTRLPKKVLKDILGKPMLLYEIERIRAMVHPIKVILATTVNKADDVLADFARKIKLDFYRGSEDDVLDRFYQAAKKYRGDVIIRITGDCPLIDPAVIDKVLDVFLEGEFDYVANTHPPTYPDGLDTEVFSFAGLERTWKEAKKKSEREHVTPYFYNNPDEFKIFNVENEEDLSKYRLTVDEQEDFDLISKIIEQFNDRWTEFSTNEVIAFMQQNEDLSDVNKQYQRDEGYKKSLLEDQIMKNKVDVSKGLELWNRAKQIIPGGTQLLSKRSEQFLPNQWPSYFDHAKGVEIWDLDGNKFIDMNLMGVGACTLGYADDDVNDAVKKVIDASSTATLNSPEEVELAELLLRLHPWAGAVRYARTGGETMAIAVRIARAYAKKEKVAFCGYHGWHDWYLSCNLADNSNLDGHLLKGLEPNGVPRSLINTSFPFEYNNIEKLEEIVNEHDIGVIVLEPFRHQEPTNDFLKNVREVADRIGAVLVVDEISIGWRLNVGGSHLIFDLKPDIACFAKAMSNGYPMGAIIGDSGIMDAAQTSFISSTSWTERVGPAASIATINKMHDVDLPSHLDRIGQLIADGWRELIEKYQLNIEILKPNALVTMNINYPNALAIKTLFTQEMLKRGYLASLSVYVSLCHTEEHVNAFLGACDEVFGIINDAIKINKVEKLLQGPVCQSGFQRLT